MRLSSVIAVSLLSLFCPKLSTTHWHLCIAPEKQSQDQLVHGVLPPTPSPLFPLPQQLIFAPVVL